MQSETDSTTTVSDYSTTDSSVHSSVDDNSVHQSGGFNSNFAPDTTTSTDLDSTIDTGLDAF